MVDISHKFRLDVDNRAILRHLQTLVNSGQVFSEVSFFAYGHISSKSSSGYGCIKNNLLFLKNIILQWRTWVFGGSNPPEIPKF
jgi:hypothetical protein